MKKKAVRRRQRKITFYRGDSRIVIKKIADNSVDSIVTDPPYALVSIVKRFGKKGSAPAKGNQAFVRASRGFMGKKWDTAETTNDSLFWAECLRVLKPGGHLISFGGTRTYHRMTCAIEDAGFEIRDMIQWLYGSGFPKSHDVSKGMDKAAGRKRKILRKRYTVKRIKPGATVVREGAWGKQNILYTATDTKPASKESKKYQGWGTALKPANEPIVLARKPLSEKTVAANVLKWGTGAINVDGCRITASGPSPSIKNRESARKNNWDATSGGIKAAKTNKLGRIQRRGNPETFKQPRPSEQLGRWPANVITDGSDEVVTAFPSTRARGNVTPTKRRKSDGIMAANNGPWGGIGPSGPIDAGDFGSAARFFYHHKASKADRAGSKHPTVKPINLLRYLIRLVTPRGGLVLDPFAGSGTTAEAAMMEKCKVILIEREKEYQNDIKKRLQRMRTRQSRKKKK